MMPRARIALFVPAKGMPGMIVRNRSNHSHAQIEHADKRCYPTHFHSLLHSYSAPAGFFKQNRPVTFPIGIERDELNWRGFDVPARGEIRNVRACPFGD
jgi:hypothetical protein